MTEPSNIAPVCPAALTKTGEARSENVELPAQTRRRGAHDPLPVRDASRYQESREHARGGMGRVAEVFDHDLKRTIAVKELIGDNPLRAERFIREAMITARLAHPGIVPVYDAGYWPDGTPFYSMKMLEGRSLKQVLAERQTLDERLALLPNIIAATEAIAYAHAHGVIHRDLKPSNIMVGDYGETVVVDWGLAKVMKDSETQRELELEAHTSPYRTTGKLDLTRTGSVLGTPAYMPPEQARGESVDERADVYALGAILYHILAGVPPFERSSSTAILKDVLAGPPRPIRERAPEAPADLCAIVDKAMACRRGERFLLAKDLVDDLRRYQGGLAVKAHEYQLRDAVRLWYRRNRSAVLVGTMMAGLMMALGVFGAVRIVESRDRAEGNERAALKARQQAEQEARRSQEFSNELILAQAQQNLNDDATASLAWLDNYPPRGKEIARAREIAVDAVMRGVASHVLPLHELGIVEIDRSRDGRFVATASYDGTAAVWDSSNGEILRIPHGDAVYGVDISPDAKLVASISKNGTWKVTPIHGGEGRQWSTDGEPAITRFSPNGDGLIATGRMPRWSHVDLQHGTVATLATREGGGWLASYIDDTTVAGTDGASLVLWDTAANTAVRYRNPDGRLTAMGVVGRQIVTGDVNGRVRSWGADGRNRLIGTHDGPVSFVALSVRGLVASGAADGSLLIHDLHGLMIDSVDQSGEVTHLAFDEHGEVLVFGDFRGEVTAWNARTHDVTRLRGHRTPVLAVQAGNMTEIISGDDSGELRVWNTPRPLSTALRGHSDRMQDVIVSGELLVTSADDGTVRFWDLDSLEPRGRLRSNDGVVKRLYPLGADQLVLSGTEGTSVWSPEPKRRWRIPRAEFQRVVTSPRAWGHGCRHVEGARPRRDMGSAWPERHPARHGAGGSQNLRLTPDARQVVTVSHDGRVVAWPLNGEAPRTLGQQKVDARSLAMSPDGKVVVTAGDDGVVRVWHLEPGVEHQAFSAHALPVTRVAVGAGGRTVYSGDQSGLVVMTDLKTGRATSLQGHDGTIHSIAVSHDGRLFASSAQDGTIRVWQAGAGEPRSVVLRGHASTPTYIDFLPDGRLVSLGNDTEVRVWSVGALPSYPTGDLASWIASRTSAKVAGADEVKSPLGTKGSDR